MQRGSLISLRATLPRRPNHRTAKPRGQYIIALGLPAKLPVIRQLVRQKAMELELQILKQGDNFDWSPWLPKDKLQTNLEAPQTIGDWVDKFLALKKQQVSVGSYEEDLMRPLIRLPRDEELTESFLREQLLALTKPRTKSRKRYATTFGALAKFAGFETNLSELARGYKPAAIHPNSIPTEDQIVQVYYSIDDPGWQWIWGILATYGCRPEEVWFVEVKLIHQEGNPVQISDGKTGGRSAYAWPSIWVDKFDLASRMMPERSHAWKKHLADGNTKRLSELPGAYFRRFTKFTPRSLRHAYSNRLELDGVPDAIAARWQGHSQTTHKLTYQRAMPTAFDSRIAAKGNRDNAHRYQGSSQKNRASEAL